MKKILNRAIGVLVIAYAILVGGIAFHYQVENKDLGWNTVMLISCAGWCLFFGKILITDGTTSKDI